MENSESKRFDKKITCAYLYTITRHGYPPPVEKTTEHIEEMAGMGFSSVELEGIGKDNIQYLYENRKEIAAHLKRCEVEVPVLCLVLPRLGSADERKRKESLELFEKGCQVASLFGAGGVLDNGPLPPFDYPANMPVMRHYTSDDLMQLSFPTEFCWDSYWEVLGETFREACQLAASYGLLYHMHPCVGSLIANTDGFENFYRLTGSENLRFNLDTANQFLLKDNLSLSIARLIEKVSYIHISDNRGMKLEHLVPGEGAIPWDLFFKTLKDYGFNGSFAIDVGGAESDTGDIETAVLRTARWLEAMISKYSLFK